MNTQFKINLSDVRFGDKFGDKFVDKFRPSAKKNNEKNTNHNVLLVFHLTSGTRALPLFYLDENPFQKEVVFPSSGFHYRFLGTKKTSVLP